jgi:hypothetical protein
MPTLMKEVLTIISVTLSKLLPQITLIYKVLTVVEDLFDATSSSNSLME